MFEFRFEEKDQNTLEVYKDGRWFMYIMDPYGNPQFCFGADATPKHMAYTLLNKLTSEFFLHWNEVVFKKVKAG